MPLTDAMTWAGTVCILFANVGMFLTICGAVFQSTHIDRSTYEEGKRQFELIQHQAELPRYGQCWKDAIQFTQTGCERLTDGVQSRLALAYLNCFLELQGRPTYECLHDASLAECTKTMQEGDRASFTTFFTHTQNICYFLRAQVWNEATENTISTLAETSSHVASQLQESSQLQAEMIKQQNDSLTNQKILIDNAANLTKVLSSSSDEINRLFHTFKETTKEQRLLITDVFEQLTSLKQTVLGEFSGFYSILYYFVSVLVCYLLTSTARTSGARFWLFSVVTASIFCENLITGMSSSFLLWVSSDVADHDEWMYWIRNWCRKLFAAVGLLVLAAFAYNYRDLNTANNQLLVEIRKQNSDLKRLLHGVQVPSMISQPNGFAVGLKPANTGSTTSRSSSDDDDDNSQSETGSLDSQSDKTFILQETDPSLSSFDSYMTAETLHGQSVPAVRDSLMGELRDLRGATPLKEMAGQVERWISTGMYSPGASSRSASSVGSASDVNPSPVGSPYMLRPRRGRPSNPASPAVQTESPTSFAKTVRHLERLAEKNSRMVCAAVTAKQHR